MTMYSMNSEPSRTYPQSAPSGSSYTQSPPPPPGVTGQPGSYSFGGYTQGQDFSPWGPGNQQNWGTGPWAGQGYGQGGTQPGWGQGWGQGGGQTFQSANPQQYTAPTSQTPGQQGQYNNLVRQMRQAQAAGQWNPGTFAQMMGAQGVPPQVSQMLWQNLASQNFAPLQSSSGTNDTEFLNQLQDAGKSYNQQLQSGAYNSYRPYQAPTNGGYGYQGGGRTSGQQGPPPWMISQLQQMGWTPPSSGQGGSGGPTPPSPVSQGAPPWAQAMAGGYSLPSFINQGSMPLPSAQQWGNFMPQEQQAILGAAQSVGIDPGAYMAQYNASVPEWGGIGQAGYQGY